MIVQGFKVNETIPDEWWVMAYYNVKSEKDIEEIRSTLNTVRLNEKKLLIV